MFSVWNIYLIFASFYNINWRGKQIVALVASDTPVLYSATQIYKSQRYEEPCARDSET